jgi:hypothetical protein
MLQKIAIHQTRLQVPGVRLDARGVCLGSRGFVLIPSLDRLVALLAIYTKEVALASVLESLKVHVLVSELGARELAVSFEAVSSDALDRVAGIGRLVGGFTFTGTSRHFVQYRDRDAPFGYDAPELLRKDAAFCLYHQSFSQVYQQQHQFDLRHLTLTLTVHPSRREFSNGPQWVLCAPALGPPLARHLASAGVEAKVASMRSEAVEGWDAVPREQWLFRLPSVPRRIAQLLKETPGLELYHEATQGAAIRDGFAHPLELRACPVFGDDELVLFPNAERAPQVLSPLPPMADVAALVRSGVTELQLVRCRGAKASDVVAKFAVGRRIVPTGFAHQSISAARLDEKDAARLRRLAYLLGTETVQGSRLAATEHGVFVVFPRASEAAALGDLYFELGEGLYIPLGHELLPRANASTVLEGLGTPRDSYVFLHADGTAHFVERGAFVPLAQALLEPGLWADAVPRQFPEALNIELPTLWLEPLGLRPLRGAR